SCPRRRRAAARAAHLDCAIFAVSARSRCGPSVRAITCGARLVDATLARPRAGRYARAANLADATLALARPRARRYTRAANLADATLALARRRAGRHMRATYLACVFLVLVAGACRDRDAARPREDAVAIDAALPDAAADAPVAAAEPPADAADAPAITK